MCLVGAVGRGQIFQLIHDAPGLGFNPAVMQSRNVGFGCPFSDRSAASFHTAFGHSQVSFTETALLNHLKPYAYLTYILDELRKMGAFPKEEELKKLLPWSEDLPEYCRTKLKK